MVIIPTYLLIVILFVPVPAVVFGTPVPQQTDFKVNVTSSTVGSIPHELDLKLTQIPGGQFSEVTGFVVSPEDVIQVKQGENLIVSTSQNLKAQQVTVRNIQGQQVNLLPLPTSMWSLQGLIAGVYTLDVIVDMSSSGILGTYETILVVLEPGQQPLSPTTVINRITIQPPPPTPCPTNSTLVNGTCINPTPPIPSPPTPCPNITSTNETCTPSPGPVPPPNATIPITPPPNATIPITPPPNATIPITPPPNATIPITPPPNATNPILPLGPGPGPGPGPNKTQPTECPLDAEGNEVCPPSPIEPGLIPLESPEVGNDETPEVGDDETPPLGDDTGGDEENGGDDDGSNDDSTGDGGGNGNNGFVGEDTFFG